MWEQIRKEVPASLIAGAATGVLTWGQTQSAAAAGGVGLGVTVLTYVLLLTVHFGYYWWLAPRRTNRRLQLRLDARTEKLREARKRVEVLEPLESEIDKKDEYISSLERKLVPRLAIDPGSIKTVLIPYPYRQRQSWVYCHVARFEIENIGMLTAWNVEARIDLGWRSDGYPDMPLLRQHSFSERDTGLFDVKGGKKQIIDIAKQLADTQHGEGAFLRLAAPRYVGRDFGFRDLLDLKITVTADDVVPIEIFVDLYFQEIPFSDSKGAGIYKQLMCRPSKKSLEA